MEEAISCRPLMGDKQTTSFHPVRGQDGVSWGGDGRGLWGFAGAAHVWVLIQVLVTQVQNND